jgi:hypothetical protein
MHTPGPNELELRAALGVKIEEGLVNMHISWGPEGERMSPEEKARYVLDHVIHRDTSKDRRITASEFDRETLAPHVPSSTWAALTKIEKRREIDRGTQDRLAKLPPMPVLTPEEEIAVLKAELTRYRALVTAYRTAARIDLTANGVICRGVDEDGYRKAWEGDFQSEIRTVEALTGGEREAV